MALEVSGIKAEAEADGSHAIELADGSTAIIPRDQVPQIALVLQRVMVQRVFAQSQRLDVPTESSLALLEFHLTDTRSATKDRETNLACNLTECGWMVLLGEDQVLRQMKIVIDQVLAERSASHRAN